MRLVQHLLQNCPINWVFSDCFNLQSGHFQELQSLIIKQRLEHENLKIASPNEVSPKNSASISSDLISPNKMAEQKDSGKLVSAGKNVSRNIVRDIRLSCVPSPNLNMDEDEKIKQNQAATLIQVRSQVDDAFKVPFQNAQVPC